MIQVGCSKRTGHAPTILIVRCCLCGRYQTSPEKWVEPDEFLPYPREALISHGYCPLCMERALRSG
jgi:hypothetical protein